MQSMSEHFDVIVIGSGAGGGTLAHSLAPTGKRILILERGGWYPRERENWDSRAVWGDLRYRNAGKWLDRDGKLFNPKQHYYVGGNTKVYGAVLFRFRERDFGAVTHVDGVSPAWPLGYDDFEPWYTKAEQLYSVHGERGSDPLEPWASAPYPWPAVSHEPRIEQLAHDLKGAGLHPFSLPLGIMLDEQQPEKSACIRCATCDGFACLVRAKADAQVVCVEPALQHPNVSLLTDTSVRRLETDATGRAVRSVVVERDGAEERYSADVVVVACGAINSAALLLASANEQHPHGLGNSSGQLGRNLMLHNNSSMIAISKEPNPTKFEKTLGVNDFYYGDGEWEFPLGAMQMLGRSDAFTMSLDAPDADDPADLAARSLDFWLTTEDLPRAGNRVELEGGRIKLTYAPTNLEAHDRLKQRFRSLLDAMRCRDEVVDRHSYLGGRLGISGVAHQNGTARFGTDPAASVLDLNCRMHDLDNVYVVDSSFFVSSSAVNPTLTIIANALRVAEHLGDRLG
jgi:choline dehydrogenase-like flavoprotein